MSLLLPSSHALVCLLLVVGRCLLLVDMVYGLQLRRRLLPCVLVLLCVAVLLIPILGCWVLVLELGLLLHVARVLLLLELVLLLGLLLLASALVLESVLRELASALVLELVVLAVLESVL